MGRKTTDPEKLARQEERAKMRELMKESNIKDMSDINELFKMMVGSVLENGLEAELDEELGYSKYDYKNRETDNYRTVRSLSATRTSRL